MIKDIPGWKEVDHLLQVKNIGDQWIELKFWKRC